MTEIEIIEVFKALSVNSRVQIIKLIKDKKLCVNAITNKLGISQSAVSQHLKILKESNLVVSDRYGSIVHYQLNKNKIYEFKSAISKIIDVDFTE